MEVKKSKKADLEGTKSTGLLIGYIVALAAMFASFEYTTREYEETDVVYATTSFVSEEEVIPITQPIFTAAPPPPADAPQVAEILDIVDNNTEIEEEKIEGGARLKEDLGIDSLEVVDVVVLVEDQFGYKMKPEDFKELHTLDQFTKFIQDHIA